MTGFSLLRCCLVATGAAGLAAFACSTDSLISVGILHPTLVEVAPEEFLGPVACADAPGAMRRYVATLVDVTEHLGTDAEPLAEFVLPSSPPVPCDQKVAFSFVAPGHLYAANIAGYDRTDLRPLSPGSPIMLGSDGHVVAPRWTTSCGRGTDSGDGGPSADAEALADAVAEDALPQFDPLGPVISVRTLTRRVRGCLPLVDHGSLGETAISLSLAGALGSLECGSAAGQVARFVASLAAPGESREASCGESVVFSGVAPGTLHELFVEAFEQDATAPRWGTRCHRTAEAGVTLPATCDPLSDVGSLAVDVAELLSSRGVACNDLAELRLVLGSRSVVRSPPDCSTPAVFGELVPGEHSVEATITLVADAGAPLTAQCRASVAPGRTVFASCSPP